MARAVNPYRHPTRVAYAMDRHHGGMASATGWGQQQNRTAELLPVVVTPYRFQSRSNFRTYCGLSIVMRSSSDWIREASGRWVKAPVQQTRGLNRNFNRTLKRVFKAAATTVIGRSEEAEPL